MCPPPEAPEPETKKKVSRFLKGSIEPEVKICKFLRGSDVIVGADMAGYLNFWSITPTGDLKNKLLCRCKYINKAELQEPVGSESQHYLDQDDSLKTENKDDG